MPRGTLSASGTPRAGGRRKQQQQQSGAGGGGGGRAHALSQQQRQRKPQPPAVSSRRRLRDQVDPLLNPSRVIEGLESLAAGGDECLESRVLGRLHRVLGLPEVQILTWLRDRANPF